MEKSVIKQQAIGIFDSGIGGLSIAQAIHQLLPNENIIYLADTAFAPYGEKSPEVITERASKIADLLIAKDIKALVVACNTATLAAIKSLREKHQIPIIGVEPGIKLAAKHTQSKQVGVLATERTLTSEGFHSLAHRVGQNLELKIQPCPKLVRLVESLNLDSQETHQAIQDYIQPLIKQGADTLILGCTHFSHLEKQIQTQAGDKIKIITTEKAVAKETKRRLEELNLLAKSNPPTCTAQLEFITNGNLELYTQQIKTLWQANYPPTCATQPAKYQITQLDF